MAVSVRLSRLASQACCFASKRRGLFARYLLITNTAITVGAQGLGDRVEQRLEQRTQNTHCWDRRRTTHVAMSGLILGPVCHFWYLFLDRILPGAALRTVGKKILLDQIIFSPLNVSMFIIIVGYLEGFPKKCLVRQLKEEGVEQVKGELIVWPPAQLVNFYLLPTKYRVLYDNIVSLAFDFYYAHDKGGDEAKIRQRYQDEQDRQSQLLNSPSRRTSFLALVLHHLVPESECVNHIQYKK